MTPGNYLGWQCSSLQHKYRWRCYNSIRCFVKLRRLGPDWLPTAHSLPPRGPTAAFSFSCTAQTRFGADMDWSCRYGNPSTPGAVGSNCPFVTMEVSGPQTGDVICRVSPYRNDAHHLCRGNASEHCHVVTMRIGPRTGTLLRVDGEPPDRNATPAPPQQKVG